MSLFMAGIVYSTSFAGDVNTHTLVATSTESISQHRVPLTSFAVHLVFTEALEEMLSSGESVILSFTVTPLNELTPAQERKLKAFMGEKEEYIVADYEMEITEERMIDIENIYIDTEVLEIIGEDNLMVSMNIYSGRKVYSNNIISGGFMSEALSDLAFGIYTVNADVL